MMAISWSDDVFDKVMVVSKFALLLSTESFLNLPNGIDGVFPNASTLPTAKERDKRIVLFDCM